MTKININGLRELCSKATEIGMDKDGTVYLPFTQYGGIPILPVRRFDIPMSKIDLDFYDTCKTTVPLLLDELELLKKAIRDYCCPACNGKEGSTCYEYKSCKALAESNERMP